MIQPFRAMLWDIEGTTTPVSFVYDVLFPYARAHLSAYLAQRWVDADVQDDVGLLCAQAAEDGLELPKSPESERLSAVQRYAHGLMDADRKVTGLKSLQGKIWRDGYADPTPNGLRGALFEDVVKALERAKAAHIPVYIYSSGSIEAQKLLFGHSQFGDLTGLLSGFFDTTTGPKRDAASYTKIAAATGHAPQEILFLTDIVPEADAAHAAGLQAAIMDRPGNAPQPTHAFPWLSDFSSLLSSNH